MPSFTVLLSVSLGADRSLSPLQGAHLSWPLLCLDRAYRTPHCSFLPTHCKRPPNDTMLNNHLPTVHIIYLMATIHYDSGRRYKDRLDLLLISKQSLCLRPEWYHLNEHHRYQYQHFRLSSSNINMMIDCHRCQHQYVRLPSLPIG